MKKIVAIVISVCLGLHPLVVLAEDCVEPFAISEPCEGVLLPPEAAAEALKCLEVDVPRLQLKLDREKEVCTIKLNTMLLRLNTLSDHNEQLEVLLDKAIDIEEPPKAIWERNTFWVSVGFLTGALTTIGIAFAIGEAK